MKHFFKTLNYSSCNEDPFTELKALDIQPGDNVASITGSGDRPLHMLLGNPDHVYAFDANEVQNYLLELKIAAIMGLDYSEYAQFLGLHTSDPEFRKDVYFYIRSCLTDGARTWFDKNLNKIRNGILYEGRWEKYFGLAAWQLNLWRGKKIDKLFSFGNIEEQREFVNSKWDTLVWQLFLVISFNKIFFRWIFGDPGFYSQVDDKFSTGRYIHKRLHEYMENFLAIESFMLALVFKGRFFSSRHYPPYLNRADYYTIKERVDRISIRNVNLDDMLDSEVGKKCNKFSLSDVSSFLSKDCYKNLYANLAKYPGRRFCIRDFLTNRSIPENCPENIQFFQELQEDLATKDSSIGYSFIVGETLN